MTNGISATNLGRFSHGGVEFDQRNGIGSVPDVANVAYMGFVVMMRPSTFLALTPMLMQPSDGIRGHIANGGAVSMGFLEIDLDEEGDFFKIRGHEGRNRTHAILDLHGDGEIPVAILFRYGGRASDVEDTHLIRLASGAHRQSSGKEPACFVPGPLFDRLFIAGPDGPQERTLSGITPGPRMP